MLGFVKCEPIEIVSGSEEVAEQTDDDSISSAEVPDLDERPQQEEYDFETFLENFGVFDDVDWPSADEPHVNNQNDEQNENGIEGDCFSCDTYLHEGIRRWLQIETAQKETWNRTAI